MCGFLAPLSPSPEPFPLFKGLRAPSPASLIIPSPPRWPSPPLPALTLPLAPLTPFPPALSIERLPAVRDRASVAVYGCGIYGRACHRSTPLVALPSSAALPPRFTLLPFLASSANCLCPHTSPPHEDMSMIGGWMPHRCPPTRLHTLDCPHHGRLTASAPPQAWPRLPPIAPCLRGPV